MGECFLLFMCQLLFVYVYLSCLVFTSVKLDMKRNLCLENSFSVLVTQLFGFEEGPPIIWPCQTLSKRLFSVVFGGPLFGLSLCHNFL